MGSRESIGGCNLGGEQTWEPEDNRMTAAPKLEPALKLQCGILSGADLVITQGRPLFRG